MEAETLTLVEPSLEYQEAFLLMVEDFRQAGERRFYQEQARQNFVSYLERWENDRQGLHLSPGYVPSTTYWLLRRNANGETILGETHLRHHLTPALEVEGGHIGYAIRPSERRKGYGARILALVLEKARQLGLERVMVTCDTDNTGSAKIIEKNGGVLEGYSISPQSHKQVSLYWIDLTG